jgi:hypothetical protein
MLSRIASIWKRQGFEIILGLCVAFIIFFALLCKIKGTKGTWSKQHYSQYPYYRRNAKPITKRGPPKESKGEIECRRVLQHLFKKPFYKARPDFLRNPVTGGSFNLELDCFDAQLRIAVEYNGIQHYQYVPYFHKNKEAFTNQKYRDFMKAQKCKDAGVLLISVPYTVEPHNIKKHLENELRRNGIQF